MQPMSMKELIFYTNTLDFLKYCLLYTHLRNDLPTI